MITIIKELISRIFMVGLTIIMLNYYWQLALIMPPISFTIINSILSRTDRVNNQIAKLLLDVLTWISYIGYLIFAIILVNLNVDKWYSWIIGIIVWLIFGQLLGFLWPKRWHFEKIEDNL